MIEHWLEEFPGLIVVDEAYQDFAQSESFATRLLDYPNLVVLHTLSKAWGMAALRLGMAFASPEIIAVLNKIKMPYNVNALTQQRALELLEHEAEMRASVRQLIALRERLASDLLKLPVVEHVFPLRCQLLAGAGARCVPPVSTPAGAKDYRPQSVTPALVRRHPAHHGGHS